MDKNAWNLFGQVLRLVVGRAKSPHQTPPSTVVSCNYSADAGHWPSGASPKHTFSPLPGLISSHLITSHHLPGAFSARVRPPTHLLRPPFSSAPIMSLLPAEVHAALTQLLQALSSSDNASRSQAEEQLNNDWVTGRPDVLLMGLVEQIQAAQEPSVRPDHARPAADRPFAHSVNLRRALSPPFFSAA